MVTTFSFNVFLISLLNWNLVPHKHTTAVHSCQVENAFSFSILPTREVNNKVRIHVPHQHFSRLNSFICPSDYLPIFFSVLYTHENFYTWPDLCLQGLAIILGNFNDWFSSHFPHCLYSMVFKNASVEWLTLCKTNLSMLQKGMDHPYLVIRGYSWCSTFSSISLSPTLLFKLR